MSGQLDTKKDLGSDWSTERYIRGVPKFTAGILKIYWRFRMDGFMVESTNIFIGHDSNTSHYR